MVSIALHRASRDDAALVHAWRAEPSTSRYQPTLQLTLEEVRSMLAQRAATPVGKTAGQFQWLIESGGEPVGWVTLTVTEDNRRHGNGIIGYTIGELFRGNGYATAGLAALVPIAFGRDAFDLERLEAVASVANTASRRVLEGNGFCLEGILRGLLIIAGERVDHALYGLLPQTDWEG